MVAVSRVDRISRLKRISEWLKEGYSYAEIARELGISRQRVWQIAKGHGLYFKPTFSLAEAAQEWNCSESTIRELIRRGVVRAERKRGRWNILTQANPRLCQVCGKPMPKGRNRYCSDEHYQLAMIKARKRGMWRRFKKRWQKQNSLQPRSNPLRGRTR